MLRAKQPGEVKIPGTPFLEALVNAVAVEVRRVRRNEQSELQKE